MKLSRHILLLFVSFLFYQLHAFAQPGFKVDIEKPKPYQERKLKAEKTGEGKMKPVKRIWQNLTTHYNYVFNANVKMTEILDRAREQHKDDYSKLLPFYNYELDVTAADSAQLDSIIYKARTGILNHDLRSEWADELYLLWAQAWHFEKKFDSASLMLQFINYAFAPQYDDGFYKYIGSNADGAKELTIVTKEEKHFLHNNTFSRNNGFIWQIRNRTEMGDYTTAGSLITTLRRDPLFPQRLADPLDEAEAYWHYSQKHWDSAAAHLLAALDGDYSRIEKARWTYLAAQMLEKAGRPDEALKLYEKVVSSTPDPVMEVYARLNLVRLNKEGGEQALDNNLAALLKMAKRDKYEDYRDIIYYMAAQMELERNNIDAATKLLIKGTKADNGNPASRSKVFLQIADVLYDQKKYVQSAPFYDSVEVEELDTVQAARVSERIPALQKIVLNSTVVNRQDSLQRVAALPQEERDALIKKTLKRLRKEQGLKEEPVATSSGSSFSTLTDNQPTELFSTEQKGEWYFYNSNTKAKGLAQFKSTWGNRPNADNWRRFAVVNQQSLSSPDRVVESPDPNTPGNGNNASGGTDLTFEGFSAKLPTTPEAIKASNDSIRAALFALGATYLNDIEDYPSAIAAFEEIKRRFPDDEGMEQVLFNLSYAYNKAGNAAAAAQTKKQLTEKYPDTRSAAIVSTGRDPQAKLTPEATKAYENVYNLFIEGSFAEAENAKRIADSTYKTNYWEPQLLYIEAVYYIKQRQDSVATDVLGTIIGQNTNQTLTEKAQNLLSVLSRRKEIEDELTRLQITRPSDEDSVAKEPVAYQKPVEKKDTAEVIKPAVDSVALAKAQQKHIADSLAEAKVTAKRLQDSLAIAKRDSIALAKQQAAKALRDSLEQKALADKQKRDSIDLARAKAAQAKKDSVALQAQLAKARRDSIAAAKVAREQAKKDSLALAKAIHDQERDSLALSKYLAKRRLDSLAKVRSDSLTLVKEKAAQARQDSLAQKALAAKQRQDSLNLAREKAAQARKDSLALQAQLAKERRDSIAAAKAAKDQARRDSIALAKAAKQARDSLAKIPPAKNPVVAAMGYTFDPNVPHYALVVLEKVDPIFVNEARNAFDRYNKESYSSERLAVQIVNVTDDTRLLIVSGLPNAAAATDWAEKAKSLAAKEIVPWLTGNRYTFSIISAPNLEVLKSKGDMSEYKKFLEQVLPGKF